MRGQLTRHRLCQTDLGSLDALIGRPTSPFAPVDRADHDDRAATLLTHRRQHEPAQAQRWPEGQIKGRLPLFVGRLHEGRCPAAAGIVNQDVDPTESLERPIDNRLLPSGSGDVGRDG